MNAIDSHRAAASNTSISSEANGKGVYDGRLLDVKTLGVTIAAMLTGKGPKVGAEKHDQKRWIGDSGLMQLVTRKHSNNPFSSPAEFSLCPGFALVLSLLFSLHFTFLSETYMTASVSTFHLRCHRPPCATASGATAGDECLDLIEHMVDFETERLLFLCLF